jgi:cold shock CspA family protein
VLGSVTKFNKRRLSGCILREDGREVLFNKASLDGLNTSLLSIGDRVEFKEQYEGKGLRARKVRFTLRFTGSFQDNARPSQTRVRRIAAKPEPRNGNAQGDHATKQNTL